MKLSLGRRSTISYSRSNIVGVRVSIGRISQSRTSKSSRIIAPHAYDNQGNTEPVEEEGVAGDSAGLATYQTLSTPEITELEVMMGAAPHPDRIAESASLASIPFPSVHGVKLCLPSLHLQSLSAPQIHFLQLCMKQHSKILGDGSRAGFLLGDGAGVGKGRQVAALILENFLRGRKRALWISASSDLALDAERDLNDIQALGYQEVSLHDYKRVMSKRKGGETEALEAVFGPTGVLFVTYSTVIKRLPQILDWFQGGSSKGEGVIVMDECHRGAGIKSAEAVLQLQTMCPLARVLYVSATGASDPKALLFAPRLGLWGMGTNYTDSKHFSKLIQGGGMGALELVAMHLKKSGAMASRSLSYEGVEFEKANISLTPEFESVYDAAVDVWNAALKEVQDAIACGAVVNEKATKMAFWADHQRFFRQLISAAKVEYVASRALHEVKEGNCVVIGLQSTGEKGTEEFVKGKGGECDDFDEPAAEILMRAILRLPDDRRRKALIAKAKALTLPPNPLDNLMELLGGVDVVAEMTGRKKRLVRQEGGKLQLQSRASSTANIDNINVEEGAKFQSGEKLVAIISDAASTGISLQADRSKTNQRLRVHMTLELPWRADKIVQQLGRTHRSNQAQPPRYVLPCSDIAGEYRFASAAASRLQQLGAMLQGDRRSASASDSLASFDIDTRPGQAALVKLFDFLKRPEWSEVRQGLEGMIDFGRPDVSTFLNRLLGLKVSQQKQIFRFYEALLATAVADAKRDQKHEDVGVRKIEGTKITLKPDPTNERYIPKYTSFYGIRDGNTASQATVKSFEVDRGIPFKTAHEIYMKEKAADPDSQCCFCSYTYVAGRWNTPHTLYALALERGERGQRVGEGGGFTSTYMLLVRPNTGYSPVHIPWGEWSSKWVPADDKDLIGPDGVSWRGSVFAKNWSNGMEKNQGARIKDVKVLTGDVLPLLPYITKEIKRRTKVYRKQTKDLSDFVINMHKIETTAYPAKGIQPQSFIGILVPSHSSLNLVMKTWWTADDQTKVLDQSPRLGFPTSVAVDADPSSNDLTLVERLEKAGWWEPPPHPLEPRALSDAPPKKPRKPRKYESKNASELEE